MHFRNTNPTKRCLAGLLVASFVLVGCDASVVLGRNLEDLVDAGALDASVSDGGEARLDGGADSGVPDAGVQPDAGADAGARDSGTPDAGVPDAGVRDAGPVDAGLPDMLLALDVPLVLERGQLATHLVRAINAGPTTGIGVKSVLQLSEFTNFVSGVDCIGSPDASTVICNHGDVDGGGEVVASFVTSANAMGFADVTGFVTTQSMEADAGNNTVRAMTAWAPVATQTLAAVPGPFVLTACFGRDLFGWVQCVPGSRLASTVVLQSDGGVIPALDAGRSYYGTWGQSANGRHFAIRLQLFSGGDYGAGYVGGADGGCFEGVGYPFDRVRDGGINSMGFQGCAM